MAYVVCRRCPDHCNTPNAPMLVAELLKKALEKIEASGRPDDDALARIDKLQAAFDEFAAMQNEDNEVCKRDRDDIRARLERLNTDVHGSAKPSAPAPPYAPPPRSKQRAEYSLDLSRDAATPLYG